MENSVRVGKRYGFTNLFEDPQAIGNGAKLGDMLIQATPLHQLHGVEHASIWKGLHIVNRDDPGMLQPRNHAGLAQQTRREISSGIRDPDHLQSHLATQSSILDAVNAPHPALT